ncbi:TetR family transcriptional regulator [Bifidobacterium pseudolongum subsp. globosum]|uniref:TetR family transcriptional regulator n=1 Tax=Bifidobacterium pseudolongum subsp. globosum TaxID=1690 RepID=A0A2N3QGQ9_9BIFI|nr:TetR/AcrR family transcriptional regulator [Bifidobacterium pseudolongum]PKU90463.1 TetR family transcriptional regulator [Bifidobacterium pseudolongum subsp. globosum]
MILTGNEDLRVVKTITGIKRSFEELVCEKDYRAISVRELCDRAQVNKKTFYHYYGSLDELLAEVQAELIDGFLARIDGYALPDDLAAVNREFFLYAERQGRVFERITCSASYVDIRDGMMARVNALGWSGSPRFLALDEFARRVLVDVVNDVTLTAYRRWVAGGKREPLGQVIDLVNTLQLGGVRALFADGAARVDLHP